MHARCSSALPLIGRGRTGLQAIRAADLTPLLHNASSVWLLLVTVLLELDTLTYERDCGLKGLDFVYLAVAVHTVSDRQRGNKRCSSSRHSKLKKMNKCVC